MRKVSVFVAVCTLAIACVVMAGGSVSGHALDVASVSSAATETAAPAPVSSDDQQLSAPGITPAAAATAPAEAAATIRTDKFDYQPGETALITGTGFAPGENVTLEVDHANGLVDGDGHLPFTVLADGNGNIQAQWFVNPDDSLHAIFLLTAVGETSGRTAKTIFTDVVTMIVDDAGADDYPGQKDLNFFTFDFAGGTSVAITWGWDDTSWSGNNTGDACALIDTDQSGSGAGKADFAYCVTVNQGGKYLAGRMYSCGDKKSDRCAQPVTLLSGVASTSDAFIIAGSDPFGTHSTPVDHFDATHITGNTCGSTPGCYTDDTVARVTLQLADTGNAAKARVLNVCSYPSQEPNSDPSECVIAPNSGFLTIYKSVTTTSDPFTFDLTDGAANDGTTQWTVNGQGYAAQNVPIAPGTIYDLTETFGTAWQNSAGTCEIQTSPTTPTGNFAAPKISNFTIQSGLETICTFTNTIRNGTLTVKKHVINDNGGTKAAADFNLHVKLNGNDVTGSPAVGSESGTQYSLPPGTYVVSEDTPPSGYTNEGITGNCAANGSITITAGGSATCTITNNDQAATLIVIKHVINDNGGSKVAADFTINVTGGSVSDDSFPGAESPGTTVTLNAGNYSVDESSDLGYTKTLGNDCSGTIANGASKTCTITNDDKPNAVSMVTRQRVILHDRALISGILRNANETASNVVFRIYTTKNQQTGECSGEVGTGEQVNIQFPNATDTSILVGTSTGIELVNNGNPNTTNDTRYWRAFYSGNNVQGSGTLNEAKSTPCTEVTTVQMVQ
jgi:Prealbumin-like fold domain